MQVRECQPCHMQANFAFQNSPTASLWNSLAQDKFCSCKKHRAIPCVLPLFCLTYVKEPINSSCNSGYRNAGTRQDEGRGASSSKPHPNVILPLLLREALFGCQLMLVHPLFPAHSIQPACSPQGRYAQNKILTEPLRLPVLLNVPTDPKTTFLSEQQSAQVLQELSCSAQTLGNLHCKPTAREFTAVTHAVLKNAHLTESPQIMGASGLKMLITIIETHLEKLSMHALSGACNVFLKFQRGKQAAKACIIKD